MKKTFFYLSLLLTLLLSKVNISIVYCQTDALSGEISYSSENNELSLGEILFIKATLHNQSSSDCIIYTNDAVLHSTVEIIDSHGHIWRANSHINPYFGKIFIKPGENEVFYIDLNDFGERFCSWCGSSFLPPGKYSVVLRFPYSMKDNEDDKRSFILHADFTVKAESNYKDIANEIEIVVSENAVTKQVFHPDSIEKFRMNRLRGLLILRDKYLISPFLQQIYNILMSAGCATKAVIEAGYCEKYIMEYLEIFGNKSIHFTKVPWIVRNATNKPEYVNYLKHYIESHSNARAADELSELLRRSEDSKLKNCFNTERK